MSKALRWALPALAFSILLFGCPPVVSVPATDPGTVATPAFNPVAGSYASDQSVTLNDATSGAAVYYTLDGSAPSASSILYAGPISVNGPSTMNTIRAIAVKSGMTSSAVADSTYAIETPFAWTDITPSGATHNQSWTGIASSVNGNHVAAEVDGGDIWTSSDYGASWTNRTAGTALSGLYWTSIASSADGSHLFASIGADGAGDLYTSPDYGATWTNRTPSGATHTQKWWGISSSSDAS
jgi:hypothetical protein